MEVDTIRREENINLNIISVIVEFNLCFPYTN